MSHAEIKGLRDDILTLAAERGMAGRLDADGAVQAVFEALAAMVATMSTSATLSVAAERFAEEFADLVEYYTTRRKEGPSHELH